jgi:hypothetical protein
MPTLDWIGKDAVLNHHREVPYHLLQAVLGPLGGAHYTAQSWQRRARYC